MTGYLAPMDDEIASGLTRVGFPDPAAFAEVTTLMEDVFGGIDTEGMVEEQTTWRDPAFPRLPVPNEFRAPWLYPTTDPELPSTSLNRAGRGDRYSHHVMTASPHGRGADIQTLFAMVLGDPSMRDAFEAATTPGQADAAGQAVTPQAHLGDSVSFSEYLCWLATRDRSASGPPAHAEPTPPPMVDWNLDADRGYGYHCWDWNRGTNTGTDPEGIDYPSPCQPPPQALGFNPGKPVLLHWEAEADPGCDDPANADHVILDGPQKGEG